MQQIPPEQVVARLTVENPWWRKVPAIPDHISSLKPRAYLDLLYNLISQIEVRRAVLLMGPRRVGKTVLLHHLIGRLLQDGVAPSEIRYVSVDHPLYNGCSLEQFLERFAEATGVTRINRGYVIFDEIQYLKNWASVEF